METEGETMSKVLFCSSRPLHRAENIEAVWDAWEGKKIFGQLNNRLLCDELFRTDTDLIITDEFIAFSLVPVIHIYHGAPAGKTYGLDMERPYIIKATTNHLDYVVTTSPDMVSLTARQSGISEDKVLSLGMPRMDKYFREWPKVSEKRTYLFAPTFRADGEPAFPEIDWSEIDRLLSDDEALLVKPHMCQDRLVWGEYKHIAHIPSQLPTTPFLMGCDVVVTDYSSILFDAHVAGKPVVLFEKDPRFRIFRSMYLPYPNGYAGRYATNEAELVEVLRSATYQTSEDINCKNKCLSSCDGHSTERIVELMKEVIDDKHR